MVSVRFFRAAIRWKFPVPCDPRVISRILFDCVASIPDDYQYLLAPREAEAFIRAELNGEVDLIAEVPIDYDPALGMMQVLTWHVFGEAVVNPPALAELQLIASTVAAEHRTLASLTGMKLDKVFVGRNFSPADFDSLLAEADMGGWS
jgi:hypothetical protein